MMPVKLLLMTITLVTVLVACGGDNDEGGTPQVANPVQNSCVHQFTRQPIPCGTPGAIPINNQHLCVDRRNGQRVPCGTPFAMPAPNHPFPNRPIGPRPFPVPGPWNPGPVPLPLPSRGASLPGDVHIVVDYWKNGFEFNVSGTRSLSRKPLLKKKCKIEAKSGYYNFRKQGDGIWIVGPGGGDLKGWFKTVVNRGSGPEQLEGQYRSRPNNEKNGRITSVVYLDFSYGVLTMSKNCQYN